MIVIVDYGMGNLRSVQKAFEKVGADVRISSDASLFKDAKAVVFPGQGSFPDAVRNLRERNLIHALRAWIKEDKPFLGICLGLQLLFQTSEEGEGVGGLGAFEGKVVRFPSEGKIPHMGWNTVRIAKARSECPILQGIPSDSYFYFVHSYYVIPKDISITAATTDYIVDFVSMIWKGNLFAMQFHPEKSQNRGLEIIEKFCRMHA